MCVFRWQWGQERALTRPELNVVPARCEPHYGSWKPNAGPLDVYYTLSHISSLRNNFNNPYFRCLFFKKDIVPHKLDWYQTHYAATGWSWTSEPLTSIFHVQGSPPASSEQNRCAFLDSYCVEVQVLDIKTGSQARKWECIVPRGTRSAPQLQGKQPTRGLCSDWRINAYVQ